MIVEAKRNGKYCDVVVSPIHFLSELRRSWVLECGQNLTHSLAECGYWQTPVCDIESGRWFMKNIRLATKEEIEQHRAFEVMLKTAKALFD